MINKAMLLFWEIFNPSDLQSSFILWFAKIAMPYSTTTTYIFRDAITVMNPVIVSTFFFMRNIKLSLITPSDQIK